MVTVAYGVRCYLHCREAFGNIDLMFVVLWNGEEGTYGDQHSNKDVVLKSA